MEGCPTYIDATLKSCIVTTEGDFTVTVVDGLRFDTGSKWMREVLVMGGTMERAMRMDTTVYAVVDADLPWREASRRLPGVESLKDLALDPAAHLPEPLRFRGVED